MMAGFCDLPAEIIIHILKHLVDPSHKPGLARLSRVCKKLHELT